MSNKIPLAYADVELQLATAISVGATSFTLSSATDDDGVALPAGKYCFTIDNGASNKEFLIGQLNGVNVTSVMSVSRQGVETSGAARAHRVGASAIITDFATIQRIADILRGVETLDGASPVAYDTVPTLSSNAQLATVGYVLSVVTGGTVNFDSQVVTGVNGGEAIVSGNLVYMNTADQEWYLCDADTAATVEGVTLGIARGSGSNGVAITNGVHLGGVYTTTGLTAGSLYFASNTAGGISTTAGTTRRVIGVALSTTRLYFFPSNSQTLTTREKEALAGGATFGAPSTTNKFITQEYNSSATGLPVVRTYLNAVSPATWTKPAGLKYVIVEVQASGGNGANATATDRKGGGGGGGGYARKLIAAASLGTTETVTIGAIGVTSSFGAHCSANSGTSATADSSFGAAGGTATGGDINIAGQAGTNGPGTTASTIALSGFGGNSVLGLGGMGVLEDSPGQAATGYGAGGSGANALGVTDRNGGNASPAIVIVTEYFS